MRMTAGGMWIVMLAVVTGTPGVVSAQENAPPEAPATDADSGPSSAPVAVDDDAALPESSVSAATALETQASEQDRHEMAPETVRGQEQDSGASSEAVLTQPTEGPASEPKKESLSVDIQGYVHTRYWVQDGAAGPSQGFEVGSARLGAAWNQGRLLDGELSLEFTEALSGSASLQVVRDAYVRVSPMRELRIRMGQFKKPFGGLELWGRSRLPLVERGISNAWIVRDLAYGGRDIGVQVEGRLLKRPRLQYSVGVFNGSGANRAEDGDSKDIAGRVEIRPLKILEFGASGSLKQFAQDAHPELPARGSMGELDAKVETKRLTVFAEGMIGQNYRSIDEAKSWSALLMAGYRIPLSDAWRLKLEPLVRGEVLKVEDHVRDAHILSATAGANLHIGKLFRLMVQGEVVRPMANTLELWTDTNSVFIQAALNLR